MDIELTVCEEKNSSNNSSSKSDKKEENPLTIKESSTLCGIDKSYFRIDPALIKFKCFFFFFLGAIGSVFPFLSVYYKQLGLSPNQIGIISGVRPLAGFISGPLWGSIADRFRIRRLVLIGSAFGWLAFITCIGFVPPAAKSDIICPLVDELLGNKTVFANYSAHLSHFPLSHSASYLAHVFRLRPDVAPAKSLHEDRGWMFDQVDMTRVLLTIAVLVLCGEILQAPCGALADSAVIGHLGGKGIHKYGHQRAFGAMALGIFSLVVGSVVSTTRTTTTMCGVEIIESNYHIAFSIYAGAMTCCFIIVWFFKFKEQKEDHAQNKPKPNPLKVFRMFLTLHYGSWLLCMFFTGVCNGVIWGFLFWHIENIGGSQLLIGLASAVCHVSEVIMFFLVFIILKHLNPVTFMILGLLGYCIRFAVFAAMTNPWLIIPTEVLQGFTFAGVWSVYVKYLSTNVPSEYLGTLQGFLHGIYWGLGSGSGFLIGGVLVQNYGAVITFWSFAVGSFVSLIIFAIVQKVSKKPKIFENYEELTN